MKFYLTRSYPIILVRIVRLDMIDFMYMLAAILAYSRTREFYYVYYVLRTVICMVTEGSVQFLALAYVVSILNFIVSSTNPHSKFDSNSVLIGCTCDIEFSGG